MLLPLLTFLYHFCFVLPVNIVNSGTVRSQHGASWTCVSSYSGLGWYPSVFPAHPPQLGRAAADWQAGAAQQETGRGCGGVRGVVSSCALKTGYFTDHPIICQLCPRVINWTHQFDRFEISFHLHHFLCIHYPGHDSINRAIFAHIQSL